MSALLYRFDHPEPFPLLSTYTTARSSVSIRVVGRGDDAALACTWDRTLEDPREPTVMLGLPLIAIDGQPERLELDLTGDLTGCRVFLEAADSCALGMTYELHGQGGTGLRTWSADAYDPTDFWEEGQGGGWGAVMLPLQLCRLGFTIGAECRSLDIRLVCLRVTGDVRLAAPGIA